MNFLVISDSHGSRENIAKAYGRCHALDAIFYLGDGSDDFDETESYLGTPLFLVRGNCDLNTELPTERIVCLDGYTIMLAHGHLFGIEPTYFDKAAARAAELGADVLLLGHTHFPLEKYLPEGTEIDGVTLKKPLRIFNPGSVGRLRSDTGFKYYFGTMSFTPKGIILGHGIL